LENTTRKPSLRQEVERAPMTFLNSLRSFGAALGGATECSGEAPKLLLAEGPDDEFMLMPCSVIVVESALAGEVLARNKVTENDKKYFLRAEYQYYKALAKLGHEVRFDRWVELGRSWKPSLWDCGGFDRKIADDNVRALFLSSRFYSITGQTEPWIGLRH